MPDPPLPAEVAALGPPDAGSGLPRFVKFRHGDLRIATQHTNGVLTGVWVWVVEPGHETMAMSEGATRYSLSVTGKRMKLPLSDAEMIQALGQPEGRRKDY